MVDYIILHSVRHWLFFLYHRYINIYISIRFFIQQCLSLSVCTTASWNSTATTVAGSPTGEVGALSTRLIMPAVVYVDDNNALYVLDPGNYRVQRFFPNSTSGTTVLNGSYGTELNQFEQSINYYIFIYVYLYFIF